MTARSPLEDGSGIPAEKGLDGPAGPELQAADLPHYFGWEYSFFKDQSIR